MPEKLDPSDFRASRWKLLPDDFALSPEGPERPPRDLIDEETWKSVIQLPDDVSITTSGDFGAAIKDADDFWGEWLYFTSDVLGPDDGRGSPLNSAVLNSLSEIQASIFNAVVGYYRTGISAMRNALEHMTIGLDFELCGNMTEFNEWINGDEDDSIKFGNSATRLSKHPRVKEFEQRLLTQTGDNMFRQKDRPKNDSGGFTRRLFSELSKYAHGVPGRTEADLWRSNGPVFCPKVFITWFGLFGMVMATSVLIIRLGVRSPNSHLSTAKELFDRALTFIPDAEDSDSLLLAVSDDIVWR